MKHYHGGPINPDTAAIKAWTGRFALLSAGTTAWDQINLVAARSCGFAIDNAAFTKWQDCVKRGIPYEGAKADWTWFYRVVEKWRRHPRFDFAIVPDVIEGTEEENDELAAQWPFPRHQGAVVWHTNESTDRLVRLAHEWPLVALGSSGEFDASSPNKLVARLKEVLPAICDANGYPICKLHGLRMMNEKIFRHIPLTSADSTNVARNIKIDSAWRGTYQPASRETRASIMVERIESINSACRLELEPLEKAA